MEKNFKLRSKILKILPSINLTFQNNPFSPGKNHKSKQDNAKNWARPHKGFSGPIVSIKPKGINGIENEEPTSPKISCMGQIKHKKKQIKKVKDIVEVKKHVTTFQKMLLHVGKPKSEGRRRKSDATAAQDNKYALEERATHLSQMKRFASGRGTFANFDWKAQVVAEEIEDYYSDEDRMNGDDDDDDEEEEFMIPFSAPILLGGGGVGVLDNLKPRKEINLWKRRTMAPPRPLQLDKVH
ncbi:uncharacterized protein At1g76070-like [Cicer arietinum]|uniref:Uncharacterized protein At1g76070-like n=1 Tax=Cicer arietinum TaxID=3827 RepID=A0A1S2Y9R8_CICAR|nr:uncharacterized protein At1g76070-like [Cicer arietinum]